MLRSDKLHCDETHPHLARALMRTACTMEGKVSIIISPLGNLWSGLEEQKGGFIITMLRCICMQCRATIVVDRPYSLRAYLEDDFRNGRSLRRGEEGVVEDSVKGNTTSVKMLLVHRRRIGIDNSLNQFKRTVSTALRVS
jgi:hypothetical protein